LKCGEKRDEIIAEVLAIMVAENIDSFPFFQKRKQMFPGRFTKLVKCRKIRIPEITVNDDFIGFRNNPLEKIKFLFLERE
jgi:hypothetical protein